MKIVVKTVLSISTILLLAIIPSCKNKGCMDSTAINYDEKADEDDGSCEFNTLSVPASYSFKNESGNSTVDFEGQKQRLDMLSEMVTYMKSANTPGVAISADNLKSMYANSSYAWVDANNLGMTGSSKQLKSKTAEADAGVQAMFEFYMDSIANLSATTVAGKYEGSSSKGGVYPKEGAKGPYLMSEKGIEYHQLIEKGLMCAVFMNQMTVNYLTALDNDDNSTPETGKSYTTMEHHWDEAFGYFTSSIDFPASGTDRFWGKYAQGREAVIGSATKLSLAFRTGRTAIVNKDYALRNAQVEIIRNEMEKVCAGTAIHYLNDAKANLSFPTIRNHSLSEAWAFLNGLRYGYNSINGISITAAEIDAALGYVGYDFNKVTVLGLQKAIDLIASKTGLTADKSNL